MEPTDMERRYEFVDGCCELTLEPEDMVRLKLDKPDILLELRPGQDSFGIFYSAKGREWDIWCHQGDWDNPGGVKFAQNDPRDAARRLLAREWRADFGFDGDE